MTEPTVQVPMSLPTREQIAEAMERAGDEWSETYLPERSFIQYAADAVFALLSLPTPTAEPPGLTQSELRAWRALDQKAASAEPPRIEEMAPGTKPCADPNVNRWYCHRGADGTCPLPKCVDPSTIRDVTPPKDAA